MGSKAIWATIKINFREDSLTSFSVITCQDGRANSTSLSSMSQVSGWSDIFSTRSLISGLFNPCTDTHLGQQCWVTRTWWENFLAIWWMFAILHYLTAFSRTQTKGILPVFLFLTSLVSAGLASQKGLYSVVVFRVNLFGPGDKGRASDHFYPT